MAKIPKFPARRSREIIAWNRELIRRIREFTDRIRASGYFSRESRG